MILTQSKIIKLPQTEILSFLCAEADLMLGIPYLYKGSGIRALIIIIFLYSLFTLFSFFACLFLLKGQSDYSEAASSTLV